MSGISRDQINSFPLEVKDSEEMTVLYCIVNLSVHDCGRSFCLGLFHQAKWLVNVQWYSKPSWKQLAAPERGMCVSYGGVEMVPWNL